MPRRLCLFVFGATGPSGPGPPHSRGFYITHNDAPQSVGFPWTSDQLVAETSTSIHTTLTTNIHGPGRIRIQNLSRRAAADPCLRPRGHWDLLPAALPLGNNPGTYCIGGWVVSISTVEGYGEESWNDKPVANRWTDYTLPVTLHVLNLNFIHFRSIWNVFVAVVCSVKQTLILTTNRKFKFLFDWPILLCSSFRPDRCMMQECIFVRCD